MHGSTILVATDLSDGAGAAARWAADLGRLTGLPVMVAHAVEIVLDAMPGGRYDLVFDPERMAAARAEVDEWYCDHVGEPPSGVEVRVGGCGEVLTAIARQYEAALLVMSRTGRNAFSHALIGSRVQRLVSRPPCPVAVVNPVEDSVERSAKFEVVAATDFSSAGAAALSFAGSLTQLTRGHLEVVHAVHVPAIRVGSIELRPASGFADQEEGVEARLREAVAAHLPGLDGVTCRALAGHPARTLVEHIRDNGADVAVLGRSGHASLIGDFLGSTPRRVIRALPCTVIVVPPA